MRCFLIMLGMLAVILQAYSDKSFESLSELKDAEKLILGYGATTLDEDNGLPRKLWYEYRVRPHFHTRKLWLGLDLTFHLDENNNFRSEDWDDFGDIIDKLDYLYYNDKTDPLYFRLGQLREVTFGTGFILNRYSNAISYPLKEKKIGLDIGLNFPHDDGMEFFVSDMDSAKLYGLRGYMVPLDYVTVGMSYVHETDPERNGKSAEGLHFIGLDVIAPVYKRKNSAFYIYENLAKILDYGAGFSTGARWELPVIDLSAEYRYYNPDFTPSYFDEYYELDARRRYLGLRALQGHDNFGGYFASAKTDLFGGKLKWRNTAEKFTGSGRKLHFFSEIKATELLFENTDISVSYDDKDANLAYFGTDKKNVAIVGQLQYDFAKNARLKFNYKRLYDEFGVSSKVSSVSTEIIF